LPFSFQRKYSNGTESLTDKLGRKVLSRVAGDHDTYYVYDDLDNLRYVIPPKAADALGFSTTGFDESTGSTLDLYGYIYHYDGRKRCIEKKLPGCAWIYMVYDQADRLTASQDGNQRTKGQWTVNRYDKFNRSVYNFIATNSQSVITATFGGTPVNETWNGNATTGGYSLTGSANLTAMLTTNYYDNYNFLSGLASTLGYQVLSGYDKAYPETATDASSLNAKGLLTGTRVYHLDNPSLFEVTTLYYDKYGRVIQTRASNHLGGYDIACNLLDFTGKPRATKKMHGISGASDTYIEYYTYNYDKAQRLLTTKHQLGTGGAQETLVTNTYDALGRVSVKNLGGVDATTYTYNVRSWVSGISGSRFTENLYYNQNSSSLPSFTACYNGNIAGLQSNIPSESLGYNRAYSFAYDGLNRLTTATSQDGKYSETYQFDKMGNITNLSRGGLQSSSPGKTFSTIDNLINFNYNGNQLTAVTDNGSSGYFYGDEEFVNNNSNQRAYDANGNMMHDASNCGIWAIGYNVLNLPNAIQFQLGHQTLYTYSAAGAKLKVVDKTAPAGVNLPVSSLDIIQANPSVASTTTTDYVGNMIYQNGALQMILLPEGYYQGGYYYYYLKDHLGSNRVVLRNDGYIAETSNYYPSGMRFGESVVSGGNVQPYRHIGKEMQSMHGLNWYDNGARMRQVDIPVWTTIDPHAERYYSISPYAYCMDNPVRLTDPDGKDATYKINGQTITVSANIFLTGRNVNVADVQKQLSSVYQDIKVKGADGKTYTVHFNISVKSFDTASKQEVNAAKKEGSYNFVRMTPKDEGTSNHSYGVGWYGQWNNTQQNGVWAHEFGHMLGFADSYYTTSQGASNYSKRSENDVMGINSNNPDYKNSNLRPGQQATRGLVNDVTNRGNSSGVIQPWSGDCWHYTLPYGQPSQTEINDASDQIPDARQTR